MNALYHEGMKRTESIRYALLVMLGMVTFIIVTPQLLQSQTGDGLFKVHFLNVGQGDAILIQTPDGHEALVDGGKTRGVLRELASQQAWHDRTIELVIATHADEDHVGGLVDVLEYYAVDMVLQTQAAGESPGAVAFAQAVQAEGAVVTYARAGQVIQLGASTTIEVLSPTIATDNWRTNAASVIVKVTYGDTAVLLSGDAPASIEDYLVNVHGDELQSDILKLGHHGSKTSTSNSFLDKVQPDFAVVSASIDNQYGHPHSDVISRVFARGIRTFHTGTDGTVSFYSDGGRVWSE